MPQGLREALGHAVFRLVDPQPGREPAMDGPDPGRAVGRDLLAQPEVQAHVEERIALAVFRGPVPVQGMFAFLEQGVVLGVLLDDVRDLELQRLGRQALPPLAPRREIEGPEPLAVIRQQHGACGPSGRVG